MNEMQSVWLGDQMNENNAEFIFSNECTFKRQTDVFVSGHPQYMFITVFTGRTDKHIRREYCRMSEP